MHGRQMRAQAVEVVQRGPRHRFGAAGHLGVTGRLRRRRQIPVPIVRPFDPHGGEHRCQRVDFAQEVLRGEAALPQLLGQGVGGGRHRDTPFDQCGEQPRDQRGVAGVVELELVDTDQHVVRQQLDALDEPEHTRQLGQLTEGGECPLGVRVLRDLVVRRRQKMGLADPEAAVQIHPHPGQHLTFAEQLLLAGPPGDGVVAELPARLYCCGLRRLGRVGAVGVETHVGERGRRNQLSDQSFWSDARVPVDQMCDIAGPVHAGTLTACCDSAYVRAR